MRNVHRLSRILLTCPAQISFRILSYSIMSVTVGFSLIFTRCLFFCPGMWCLTHCFPSLFVRLLASSLLVWCPWFCAVCYCWKYAWVVDLSLQACSNVWMSLKTSPRFANAIHPALILLWISLSWFCVSGGVSLSKEDVAFNDLDLSVVDIY